MKTVNDLNLQTHIKNRAIGMISASRGHLSDEDNHERTRQLYNDLRANKDHHVIKTVGSFIENYGKSNAKEVKEDSFLVMNKKTGNDNGKLKSHLKRFGQKYEQDSILHKPHNSDIAHFHGTNETGFPGMHNTHEVGKLVMNKKSEFSTKLPNGHHFTFEEGIEWVGVILK